MACLTKGYRDDDFLQIAHRFWPTNSNSIWNCLNDIMVQLESTTKCHEEVFFSYPAELIDLHNTLILHFICKEICNLQLHVWSAFAQLAANLSFKVSWRLDGPQISVLQDYFGRGVVKMDYLKKSSSANYFNWIRFYLLCIWTQI